jgi:hypothetical protein
MMEITECIGDIVPWHICATDDFNLVPETTPTGMANTVFTANSRTTHKMNAEIEFGKTNHAQTNKDVYMTSNSDQNEQGQLHGFRS